MPIIDFTIQVDNPSDISSIFDTIQVWRSPDESGSPTAYIEITAGSASAAKAQGTTTSPWSISGQSLSIILNAADSKTVNFSGSNPLILQSVISQINAIFPGLASEIPTDTNKVQLKSVITGTQSAIEISGSAATVLGLPTTHINGKASRLLLSENTESYLFQDFDGSESFWYKTRYYNSITGATSDFSIPRLGGDGTGLDASLTVIGNIAICDLTGSPVVGVRIILVPNTAQLVVNTNALSYGILPSVNRIELLTDTNGKASTSLVIGQRLKVFIEGTTFQREFEVPDDDFNILEVASTEPDPFSIVVAPPLPIRVS